MEKPISFHATTPGTADIVIASAQKNKKTSFITQRQSRNYFCAGHVFGRTRTTRRCLTLAMQVWHEFAARQLWMIALTCPHNQGCLADWM